MSLPIKSVFEHPPVSVPLSGSFFYKLPLSIVFNDIGVEWLENDHVVLCVGKNINHETRIKPIFERGTIRCEELTKINPVIIRGTGTQTGVCRRQANSKTTAALCQRVNGFLPG